MKKKNAKIIAAVMITALTAAGVPVGAYAAENMQSRANTATGGAYSVSSSDICGYFSREKNRTSLMNDLAAVLNGEFTEITFSDPVNIPFFDNVNRITPGKRGCMTVILYKGGKACAMMDIFADNGSVTGYSIIPVTEEFIGIGIRNFTMFCCESPDGGAHIYALTSDGYCVPADKGAPAVYTDSKFYARLAGYCEVRTDTEETFLITEEDLYDIDTCYDEPYEDEDSVDIYEDETGIDKEYYDGYYVTVPFFGVGFDSFDALANNRGKAADEFDTPFLNDRDFIYVPASEKDDLEDITDIFISEDEFTVSYDDDFFTYYYGDDNSDYSYWYSVFAEPLGEKISVSGAEYYLFSGKTYCHRDGKYFCFSDSLVTDSDYDEPAAKIYLDKHLRERKGKLYYINDGGRKESGWHSIGSHSYYFRKSDKSAICGKKAKIGGVVYEFNENGVCLGKAKSLS